MMQWEKYGAAVLVIILSLAVSGCATPCNPIIIEPVPLPLPTRQKLPIVKKSDLACLTDKTYHALVERDIKRKNYGNQCRAIIESTH